MLKDLLNKKLAATEPGIAVFDYSKVEDFNELWRMGELPVRIIILWFGTPHDPATEPVDTAKHVSPLHWAAVHTSSGADKRVLIVNLSGFGSSIVPLVKFHEDLNPERLAQIRVIRAFDLVRAAENPVCLAQTLFPTAKESPIPPARWIEAIRDEVTSQHDRESRHALSNIMGPLILLGEEKVAVSTGANHRLALCQIFRACKLMSKADPPPPEGTGEAIQAEPPKWLPEAVKVDEVALWLIDDQHHHGWHDWVGSQVGFPLVAEKNIFNLLEALKNAAAAGGKFKLQGPPGHETKQPVLLLDLRLQDQEGGNAKHLTALRRCLTELKQGRGLPAKAIAKLEADLKNAEPDQAITVVARLVALVDFTVPVVLFSSAGGRGVTDSVKEHPNIIASFEKPRLFSPGDTDAIAESAQRNFRKAIRRAAAWLRTRKTIDTLMHPELPWLLAPAFEPPLASECKHIEIYFDESGSSIQETFRCSALVIGYRDEPHAKTVHDAMERSGHHWVHYSRDPRARVGQFSRHKDGVFEKDSWRNRYPAGPFTGDEKWENTIKGSITPHFRDTWATTVTLFRTVRIPEANDLASFCDPLSLDNVLFDLFKLCMEMVLFELLPAWGFNEGNCPTVAIYGATRWQVLVPSDASKPAAQALASDLRQKLGLEAKPDQDITTRQWRAKYRSLFSHTFYSLVADVFASRPSTAFVSALSQRISPILGVMLRADRGAPDVDFRHQHYLADLVAHFSSFDRAKGKFWLRAMDDWDPFEKTGVGYLGRRDDPFLGLVDISRRLDAGEFAAALASCHILNDLTELDCRRECLLLRAIWERLAREATKLSAMRFAEVVRLQKMESSKPVMRTSRADRFSVHRKSPAKQRDGSHSRPNPKTSLASHKKTGDRAQVRQHPSPTAQPLQSGVTTNPFAVIPQNFVVPNTIEETSDRNEGIR